MAGSESKSYAAPQVSTYKQERVAIVGNFQNRFSDSSKDQRFVNCFPELQKDTITEAKKIYTVKRAGLDVYSTVVGGGAAGRGCFYWEGALYSVFGTTVYRNTSAILTLSTSTGTCGFIEADGTALGSPVPKVLFLSDGTKAYWIQSDGTDTEITDVDLPTPHIAQPVFLDGYVFLLDSGTPSLYNCTVNKPDDWVSTNFIDAESFQDDGVGIARVANLIVVFGRFTTEFMFNNGNATGSPLSRSDMGVLQVGCANKDTICQNERFCIFVSQSDSGGRAVWRIDGYQPKKISHEAIDKLLDAEGANISNAVAMDLRLQGHYFYILNLTNRTLVYDIEEDFWSEWSTNNSGSHSKFKYAYMCDPLVGMPVIQHDTDGKLYKFNHATYDDAGTSIITQITTTKLDFGTYNRKFLHEIELVGDSTTTASAVTVKWSDDDYNTWTSGRDVDMVYTSRPRLTRLGAFRRRAFDLKHTASQPLRLEAMEFRFNAGMH